MGAPFPAIFVLVLSPGFFKTRQFPWKRKILMWKSAAEWAQSSTFAEPISSGCPAVDRAFFPLHHGIPSKSITEIAGMPGTGKTSFAYLSLLIELSLSHLEFN